MCKFWCLNTGTQFIPNNITNSIWLLLFSGLKILGENTSAKFRCLHGSLYFIDNFLFNVIIKKIMPNNSD